MTKSNQIDTENPAVITPDDEVFQENFIKSLEDPAKEIATVGINKTFDWLGAASDVPVVSLVVGLAKAGNAWLGYRFAKKLAVFINGINTGKVDPDVMKDFLRDLRGNPSERAKIINEVSDTIDRVRDESMALILSKIFIAYIRGYITWEKFIGLSVCIEHLNPYGTRGFIEHAIPGGVHNMGGAYIEGLMLSAGIAQRHGSHLSINELGRDLLKYGYLTDSSHHVAIEIVRKYVSLKPDGEIDKARNELKQSLGVVPRSDLEYYRTAECKGVLKKILDEVLSQL